jgi:peroxiredoxin (alkyl hydroperoxide reductase subunit C)
MMQIGQTISNGTYQAFHKEQIRSLKLSEFRGKWVALVFYPGDFTFICPTELQELGGLYPEFQKLGAEVLSVSTDSVFVHKAWHDTSPAIKEIRYPMVADPTGCLSREFGTYLEDEGVSLRGSFLIDPDGVVKVGEIHDNSIGRNAHELLRKLQAAVHVREGKGEVCPASWKPGDKTLQPGLELVGKI